MLVVMKKQNKIVISGLAGSGNMCLASVVAEQLRELGLNVTVDSDGESLPEPLDATNRMIDAMLTGDIAVNVVVKQEPRTNGEPALIDFKHLDQDIVSALGSCITRSVKPGDQEIRLAFEVMAKHVNAALEFRAGSDADIGIIRKLDAGCDRVVEALGFPAGGADFDMMVAEIKRLRDNKKS